MVSAWMGKGRWMPRSARAAASSGDTPSSSKVGCVMSEGVDATGPGRPVQPGRTFSIAPTISGASGSTVGAKRADDLATRGHQELLEVPADVAGVALGVGDRA